MNINIKQIKIPPAYKLQYGIFLKTFINLVMLCSLINDNAYYVLCKPSAESILEENEF